jgi:hypothetical protein
MVLVYSLQLSVVSYQYTVVSVPHPFSPVVYENRMTNTLLGYLSYKNRGVFDINRLSPFRKRGRGYLRGTVPPRGAKPIFIEPFSKPKKLKKVAYPVWRR